METYKQVYEQIAEKFYLMIGRIIDGGEPFPTSLKFISANKNSELKNELEFLEQLMVDNFKKGANELG